MRSFTANSRGLGILFAVAGVVAGQTEQAGAQTTLIVNTLADSIDVSPGDGICLDANGFCSLRAAIMEANQTAGIVDVQFAVNGFHFLNLAGTDDACLVGDLDIQPTAALTELNLNGNGGGNTTISCAGLPLPPNRDRVFHIPSSAPNGLIVRLSGITIRDGHASGTTGSNGGGVLMQGGMRLELQNFEIQECTAALDGGGLWSDRDVTVQLSSLTMRDNDAGDDGGGLYLSGPATMNGGFFAENNVAGNRGGAARIAAGATAILADVVIQFNEATQGGGIANSGNTTIDFLIAVLNQATGGGNGGAFANQDGGILTVSPTIPGYVAENHADNGGGAINNQFGCTLVLESVALRNNHATNLGGAISNGGDASVSHCEISRNRSDGLIVNAAGGGGVYNQNPLGVMRAVNCTFSENAAPAGYGGGIENDFGARCELSACTFWGNRSTSGHSLFNGNTLGSASVMDVVGTIIDSAPSLPGNNVVAAAPVNSSGNNINVDGTGMIPTASDQFGSIGSPIATMLSPLVACGGLQAHFPAPTSPAIDRGACFDLAGNPIVDDQCSNPRPMDGDGNGFADCDVGAIEAPAMPPLCPTCRGDMDGDNFVDGRDVGGFVSCILAGPAPIIAPGCACADMDFDGVLDLSIDVPLFVDKVLGIGDPNPACP
jgi:CSLREA domain-containing protein